MALDVIIIGSGPGGYVCAIKCAQLGLKVAIVEKRKAHGGTCLNIGCIPSKALLHTSELFESAVKDFESFGISVKPKLDLAKMHGHKKKTIDGNVAGISYLFGKNKIEAYHGTAKIVAPGQVEISGDKDKRQTLQAKSIVIATGSDVTPLPGVEIDEKRIVSSTGALELEKVPGELLVIGAGVIGLELGSVWRRLGSKVTVVEFMDKILGPMDGDVSRQFQRILTKQGMKFHLSTKVTAVGKKGKKLEIECAPAAGGPAKTLSADIVLVAIGRRPFTDGLGLDGLGIALDKAGRIPIDGRFQSKIPGIYAIGDVVAGPMLAHKAEDEGVALAEILAGQAAHDEEMRVPNVIYTSPEVASIGASEEELKAANISYAVGKFPLSANGRAKAMGHSEGFVKILSDANSDAVLGAHIVAHGAGELIHEIAVLMGFGGSSEDIARICHAHPTLSEAVREAAMAAYDKPIHF